MKAKTNAPAWCILNAGLFALSEQENDIINTHNEVWRDHCDGGQACDVMTLESEWSGLIRAAEAGDDAALETVRKHGNFESFARIRRLEQTARRAKFDRENCVLFAEVHGIAKRCREIVEKHLKRYRDAGEDVRRLIEVSPIVHDDATAKMEDLIADCAKVENYNPSAFEVLANHIELREVEQ